MTKTRSFNEIEKQGLIIAGVLIPLSFLAAVTTLIACWPSGSPASATANAEWYEGRLFAFTLLPQQTGMNAHRIHINSIMIVLVAASGFLGNLVYVTSSFINFVGNKRFRKSWALWYLLKPFTAAGLAVVVYFIIRGGFLAYRADMNGVGLYGLLGFAALTGLFTDSATLKMKEVFDVIFKPADDRRDTLDGTNGSNDNTFHVASLTPQPLGHNPLTITLTGTNMAQPGLMVIIDQAVIAGVTITENRIDIRYTPTALNISSGWAILLIADNTGKAFYTAKLKV